MLCTDVTHCTAVCSALQCHCNPQQVTNQKKLNWPGSTFRGRRLERLLMQYWSSGAPSHFGGGRLASTMEIGDLPEKIGDSEGCPPLRSCESLALKLLLQQSLIWEFQEKFHAPRAPHCKWMWLCGFLWKYQRIQRSWKTINRINWWERFWEYLNPDEDGRAFLENVLKDIKRVGRREAVWIFLLVCF